MRGVTIFDRMAQEYDLWFDENSATYQAEVEALASFIPSNGLGLEVGVGTGRFASMLDVAFGIDPAGEALKLAHLRGISVSQALGEHLPFRENQFDYVLLITVDPFVSDILILLKEMWRVLKREGLVLIGMIDRKSHLGQLYEEQKDSDPFYREARFHSAEEMIAHLHTTGYGFVKARQTLIGEPRPGAGMENVQDNSRNQASSLKEGYGSGAFVALCATKQPNQKGMATERE
jgi:ubiquinone/menaquinone biosynthesis C-methylase UbiE